MTDWTADVPIAPGEIAINRRDTVARGRIIKATAWRNAQLAVATSLRLQWGRPSPLRTRVKVTIVSRWPTWSHVAGVPRGDIDAPIKAIHDALAMAGVIADDEQIVEAVQRKAPADGVPGFTVRVEELP